VTNHLPKPKASAKVYGNIASFVSNEGYQNQSLIAFQPQIQSPEIPGSIDPDKVFNLYHKQHEREKCEEVEGKVPAEKKAVAVVGQLQATSTSTFYWH
jgi:hypothetical protein